MEAKIRNRQRKWLACGVPCGRALPASVPCLEDMRPCPLHRVHLFFSEQPLEGENYPPGSVAEEEGQPPKRDVPESSVPAEASEPANENQKECLGGLRQPGGCNSLPKWQQRHKAHRAVLDFKWQLCCRRWRKGLPWQVGHSHQYNSIWISVVRLARIWHNWLKMSTMTRWVQSIPLPNCNQCWIVFRTLSGRLRETRLMPIQVWRLWLTSH